MPWFKVDDNLPTHPKVLGLPRGQRRLAAMGAWTLTGAWCSKHPAQEGVVPDGVLEELGVPVKTAADLVSVGLWVRVDGGYRFHDFTDYNPSAAEAAGLRQARSEAGRRGGLASGRARRSNEANREASAQQIVEAKRTPSRPVPTHYLSVVEVGEEVEVSRRAKSARK